jgi:predicted nucleotidyltransferase/uncharacterized protein (UPF0332 family)
MKIKVPRGPNFEHKYNPADLKIARKFANKIYKELGDFVVALTMFGSTARGERHKHGDIDILIIIDDIHVVLNREIVETYRIIIAKAAADISPKRLHVQTMAWSSFWEYVRVGDPVAMNVLRDSIALIDIGFFDPLQILLTSGRIRPTLESVWTYFAMAPASIQKSQTHIDMSIVDLYWAAIDASHAALMALGEIPESPSHVADMIQEKMVKPGHVKKKYADIMRHLYEISKRILHRQASNLDGRDYDHYRRLTDDFVKTMRKFIEKRHAKE